MATVYPRTGVYRLEDYLSLLDPPGYRLELARGALTAIPAPGPRHQHACGQLRSALHGAVTGLGWEVYPPINLVLAADTSRQPDVTILTSIPVGDPIAVPAAGAICVAELVSPGSEYADFHDKPAEYAAAGILWFIRLEDTPAGWSGEVLTLEDTGAARPEYVQVAVAGPAGELHVPFLDLTINLRDLG
ncbi:Uma2 family endonuclease [Longispora albida]|uniref:Uma2 family endonuclease n=1 Tax=Longispora albida TaxID=203523 RepID=UPI00036D89D1|nr:Uma2 family endonuclease [Longispora albida]